MATSAWAQSNIVYAAEYNQSTNRFGTINLVNGNFTRISTIGGAVINDIAYCPTNGALYGISNSTALVTFNKTNGAMLKVASFSVTGIQSLAFRPTDGVLFGATRNRLYTINITNGTATSVGLYGSTHNLGSTGQNIRFAQDGNLYVSNTSTNTDIYRVSTSTGSATWMGEAVGYPYLILENGGSNTMYGVYINLGSSTNPSPVLAAFNLASFVVGGTNADGSTHHVTVNLVGAGTNFPPNFNFTGNNTQSVTNLTIRVSAVGPVNQTVCPGDSVTFSTVASGTEPYSYAWLKDNAVISGQTNSSLTLNNVSAGDAATYSVIVNGLMGSVTNSATLTVNTPVTATPLNNLTVCPGDSAIFSTVASGTGPFNYAWLKNGALISGQNGSTLTLNNVSASDAATYSVIVNGACGSVTNSATLTVNVPVTVTVPPVDQTTVVGSNVTFSVTATGTGLSYQWLSSGSVIGTASSLTLNNVTTGQAGAYTVIVSGACGSVTNSVTLTVDVPVTVTVPPVDQTTVVGSNVTFSVTALGTGLSYQWLSGGSVIGTASSLTLNNVTTGQAGVYTVIVNGAAGSPVTNNATLTVNVPVTVTVPPVDQTTVVGSNVTFSVTATGTSLSYQWLFDGSVVGTASSLSLNNVTTGQAGVYTVMVSGAAGSPVTNSAALTVNVPVTVTVPPVDQTTVVGSNVTFSVTATGTSLSYQWLSGGSVIGTASSLTLNNVTTGQAGVYTVIVGGAAGTPVTNSATLTVNVPVTVTVPPVDQTTVVGSNVTFSVTATGTGLSYQWLFNGSVVGMGSSLTLNNVTTGQAGVYTVIVSGAAGSPVTNSATLTVNVPVTVTVPPVDQTTVVGSNVTFSVTATGTGLSYQWLFNGSVVGNASGLTLNSVTPLQAGIYTVIVNGTCGSATNSATLTVNVPVTATPLSNLVRFQGDNAAFSTVASGTGPFNYAWLKNGSAIAGQNNDTLALNSVTTNDAASYAVIVCGACGSVTNSATLTVNISMHPTLSIVPQGDGSVRVTASGGTSGQRYSLQISTDLIHWTDVSTNTADSNGASAFVGLDVRNYQHCLYRTVTP